MCVNNDECAHVYRHPHLSMYRVPFVLHIDYTRSNGFV